MNKFSIIGFFIFGIFLFSCNASKKLANVNEKEVLENTIKQFVQCYNSQNFECLSNLYHKNYQGISPITKPENITAFIKSTIDNFKKNDFLAVTQIKEIEVGNDQGFVTMNWQLRSKDNAEDQPDVDVQRLDIWKKDRSKQWKIFRTIIYKEQTF